MSRATEIAEREAAAAEAEEPTPEPEPEDAPEDDDEDDAAPTTEPEPEPVTEAQLRAIGAKIQAEDERHEKRLRAILGDLWEGREPCPLCLQEGFIIPAAPGEFDPAQAEAVRVAIGEGGLGRYNPDPLNERCANCNGWGELRSGAQREATQLVVCNACSGNGYVAKTPPNVAQFPTPAAGASDTWTPPPPPTEPNLDRWGRPMGHPDWGLDPASVVSVR
jgi:hypothetical protein